METKNVTPGKPRVNGAIFRAPLGTPVPVDATSILDEAFKELGYVSTEGVTNANTATKTKHYAWGGTPVGSSTTEKPDDFTYTLLESLNPEVLKVVYGDANVTVSEDGKSISVKATAKDNEACVYVIDMAMGVNALKRIVLPEAELSNVAEIVYQDSTPVGYRITISAHYDSDGVSHHEYITKNDAAAVAPAFNNSEANGEGEA